MVNQGEVKTIASTIVKCFKAGHKVLIAGNGGSAAQASHLSGEFLGSFEGKTKPLPAISLTDSPTITAISNDFSFKEVFARQLIALGKEGDLFIGLSTSGRSENVLYAIEWANKLGLKVVDFPRKGKTTAKIQENQLKLIHLIVREVRRVLG